MATDHKFKVKNGLHTQNIEFVDSNNTHSITASMLTTDTLSFSGGAGQLFSLTDSMSGTIFSVNDVSGIPSIEVDDDGTIRLAETSGNILIGTDTDDGSTKLQVEGSVKVTGFTTSGQLDVGTQNIKIGNNYIYASGDSNSIHVNAVTSFIPDSTTTANNPDLGLSTYRWKSIYGGFVSSSGDVQADTHFTSSDSNATLSSSGTGGNVYLRPNGKSSTSGQVHISSTGHLESNGNLTVNSGAITVSGVEDSQLNLNSTDSGPVYIAFKRASSRKAYLGFGSTNDHLYIDNETANGLIYYKVNGTGKHSFGVDSTTYTEIDSNGLTVYSNADSPLKVRSIDTTWSGIQFRDNANVTDNIYYYGASATFSIGGGGSTVSGKKLHVDGGTTIGSSYDSTTVASDGLTVQGDTAFHSSSHLFGSSNQITTQMYLRAQNTAGAPARATAFHFEGYEKRGQGLFFRDTDLANEEWFAGIPYNSQFNRFAIGHHSTTGTKQSEYNANELFSVDTDNNVRLNNVIFLTSTSTYHQIRGRDGNTAIYLGGSGDNRNYYDSAHHRWRTDNGAANLGEWSQTGLHIGGITTPSEKLEVTGNASIGDASNIAMSSASAGQLKIKGNGYTGAIALNDSAMHIYHNSNSRSLVLGTDETARLTISGTGGATFSSSLSVNSNFLLYSTGSNDAYANADSRDSGNGVRLHRFNRDNTNSAYLPYYENWYDGDSYHSIGVESNRWKFNAGVDVSGTITATGEGHTFYSSSNSIKFGRNANENIQIIVTDGANKIVATQDSDGDTGHDFILDRVFNASSGSSNFYIRNAGSNQLTIDKNANVTIAGNLTVQGTTTTIDTANLNVEDNNITLNYSTGDSSGSADGAGITIQDAVNGTTDAFMNWNATHDIFQFSHSATFGYTTIDPDLFLGTSGGFGNIADGSGWGARGLFIHGGGTGDAAAIGHNGSALFFGIQNGSSANSMDTWLTVQPNKSTNFAAQLSVSGHGNSSQWNTAYGWGDHASAGYITGVTAGAGLTGGGSSGAVTVAMDWTTSDTFTGTYGLVWNASNVPYTASWLQVRGSDDTLLTRNITATGNIISDGLEIQDGEGLRLKGGARSDAIEGTYYNWFQTGAGTDTSTWWKVCDVTIDTGLYKALAMHIRLKSQYGNYGSSEHVAFSDYTALFPRSGGVQDDAGTPRLSGYDTDNHELRIYKTGNGVYQLQSRMKISYRDLIAEIQVLSTNGGSVTVPSSGTAGTTSGGTAYIATAPTISTSPHYYMGKTKVSELKQGDNTIVDTIGRIYSGNNGSTSSPSISRGTDTDTGFYFPVGNEIGIVTGAAERVRISNNSVQIGNTSGDRDARLTVHATGAAPNISSTTPSGYTAVFGNSDAGYGTLFATDGTGRGYIQQRRTNNATTYPLILQPYGSGVGFNTGGSAPNHFYDFVLPASADNLVIRQSGQSFTPAGTAITGLAVRNTGTSANYSIFETQTGSGTAFQIRNNGDARILNNTYVGNGLYVNNTLVIDSNRNIKIPNGVVAGPSLRFYVDENTGLFRQYEGVVSFASDGTNVLDVGKYLKQPYGTTFQFPASTQGWRKLAKIDTRGGGRLVISFTGGNFAPTTFVIDYFKDWSTTCNLKLEQYGTSAYITKARLRTDSSDSKIYLEIYLNNTSSNTDNSVLVFDQRLLGYNATTTVYTGALSAGSSSGTTHSEMDFLPQGSTFNKLNVEEATTLDSTLTVSGQSTLARPVLVNGANDNIGRADFAVDVGGSPQVSLYGNQVQMGSTDMNWAAKFFYDSSGGHVAVWDNDLEFFTQGSNTGSATARDIIFKPQIGGTAVPTERMRIKGATGNVGIGVTNPQYLLHMNGGATRTDVQVTLDGYGEGVSDGAQFGIQTQGAYIWNYENTDLYFATNNTRRLTIDEDGQVGIGTDSPTAVLSLIDPDLTTTGQGLAGLRVHRPNSASQYGYVDYDYGGGGINIGSLYSGGGNSVYGTFHFRQHNAAGSQTAMFIDNVGKVGIGTTTPDAPLDIEKTASGTSFVPYLQLGQTYTVANSKYGIDFKNTQYSWNQGRISIERQGSNSDFDMVLSSAGSGSLVEGIRIDHLGTVGIGTSSPNSGSKLHVAGSVRITSAASDQNTNADTGTIPVTSGADVLRLEGGYTNGQYTTEFAKIDRSGNLPLYIRESRGTANSFTNIMRIGGHGQTDGSYAAEVFGALKVAGDILSTGNEHYFVSTNNYIEVDQNAGTRFRFHLNGAKQAELIRVSGAQGQFAVGQYSTGSTADGYPAFTSIVDTDTGLYFNGDNQVGLTTGGSARLVCQNNNDVIIGGHPSNNHYDSVTSARLSFGGGNDFNNYSIGTSMENYGGNYTKLDLRWHTGIRMGAQSIYGGIRIFDSEDFGNILVSFGRGDGNTRIERNSLIHEHTSTANAIIINRDVGGNITLGNDATYGSHNSGANRYVTLGLGGNANGSNRIFASNGNGDGMYFAAATGRGFYWRTNGGAATQMTLSAAGYLGISTAAPQKILDVVVPNNTFASFANTISTNNWTGVHFGYREDNNFYRKSAIVFERTDLTENNAQGKVHILNGPQSGAGNCTLSDAALTIRENGAVVLPKSVLEFQNGSNTITASMLSSDTLSFSGDSGQLFSLTDSMSGTIFSVNDVSGIPSIEVEDDGTIYLAESTGNVLIGTGTDNGSDKLQLAGDATVTGNVTAYGSASDINVKENIEVIPDAVKKVQKLDGVTFNYKKDGSRSTGLIAQQLQEVLPEVVYETVDLEGTEHLAVRYGNVVGLLVEAIKEQQTQLTAQQEQINQLTTLVNKLMEK